MLINKILRKIREEVGPAGRPGEWASAIIPWKPIFKNGLKKSFTFSFAGP